jgi:hypothetical protein
VDRHCASVRILELLRPAAPTWERGVMLAHRWPSMQLKVMPFGELMSSMTPPITTTQSNHKVSVTTASGPSAQEYNTASDAESVGAVERGLGGVRVHTRRIPTR